MNDIHEMYKRAGELHGHFCPGLAIGVRAAAEALKMLEVTDIQSHGLYCVAEKNACYTDGIQVLFGATTGKGNLTFRLTGKSAFSFYNEDNGASTRLVMKNLPAGMDKDAMTEHILTGPLDEIFTVGPVRFPRPQSAKRSPELACSVCGEFTDEDKLRVKDGKPICIDCLEGK